MCCSGMKEWNTPSSLPSGRTPGFQLPLGGRLRQEPAPGWTGNIYNARVLVVQRKQEQLVVRASDLMVCVREKKNLLFGTVS
jgi:putative helicase MOV10L1/helicase MOV-10